MTKFLAQSRKAVAAGILAAGAVAPSVAVVDNELVRYGAIAGAFVVAFAAVWFVPNASASE
jgi:hypothetical protein